MSRPSTIRVLCLFARTGVRRVFNRMAVARQQLAKRSTPTGSPGPDKAAIRTGTVRRGVRKTVCGRICKGGFAFFMLLGMACLTVMPTITLIASVRIQEMQSLDSIPIWRKDYDRLQAALELTSETAREDEIKTIATSLVSESAGEWIRRLAEEEVNKRLDSQGMDAFRPVTDAPAWRGDLALLTPEGRSNALRAAGLFLFAFNISIAIAWFAITGSVSSNGNSEFAWLFQFPVSRRVLFLSKLFEYSVNSPVIVTTPFISAAVLWGCGFGIWMGVALIGTFWVSAAIALGSLRLLTESILTQSCTRKTRGTVAALAGIVGSMGIMCVANASSTPAVTEMIVQIASSIPNVLYWTPLNACFGAAATDGQLPLTWWIVAPLEALVIAATAVALSARLAARGPNPVNNSGRRARTSRSGAGLPGSLFRGLVWKELAQVLRQRVFLFQTILAPVPILFVLYLTNPKGSWEMLTSNAGTICATMFTVFAYQLMCVGGAAVRTELKTFWLLQCLPMSLADCIRTKARVWSCLVASIGLLMLLSAAPFISIDAMGFASRLPFLLIYLWLFAEITFGFVSLNSTIESEDRVSIRWSMWLVPALIALACNLALHSGGIWNSLSLASILLVLSMAVGQKQRAELPWLTEPVERPPVRLYAMHGLLAVFGFQFLQLPLSLALGQSSLGARAVVAFSFYGSILVVTIATWFWLRRTGLRILTEPCAASVWKPLAAAMLAMCLIGGAVVGILQYSPEIAAASQYSVRLPSRFSFDEWESMSFIAMVVIAAPLFEEWIFRGLLYRSLRKSWGFAVSVGLTTLVFTVIHPLVSSVAVATLSIVACFLVEKTGRLWPAIVAHMTLNIVVVAMWNVTAI